MLLSIALVAMPAGAPPTSLIEGPLIRGKPPSIALMVSHPGTLDWDRVLVYRTPRTWVLRRARHHGGQRLLWTTAATCPAALEVIADTMTLPLKSDPTGVDGGGIAIARIRDGVLESATSDQDSGR